MRICIIHNEQSNEINHIVDLVSNKYSLTKIDLDIDNIDELSMKLLLNNTVTNMTLYDYIKVKEYLKHMIICYVNRSEDNEKVINDNNLWDDDLFTFRILNNKILSDEQIADMIYEASYGREVLNKERKNFMYEVKENELLFAKTKGDAIIPTKRDEDGCYDIYACFDEDEITIEPLTN